MTSTTAAQEDLQLFFKSNIATDGDLNLKHVQSLLAARRDQQKTLDAKLTTLTANTKSILATSLDNANTHNRTLEQLETSLTETTQRIEEYIKTHDVNTCSFLENLNTLEQKLRTIENARSYVKALLIASELSSQALELVKSEPEKAITPYIQLVKFEQYIQQQQQQQQQSGNSDLSAHLQKTQIRLWEELNQVLSENFKATLDALSWPTVIKPPYGPQLKPKLKAFEKAFKNLLVLQQSSQREREKNTILSPIALMLEGLSLRFRFHFETSKPTNRIDKPEWYLTHVKNTISTHMPFLMTTVQPILESAQNSLPVYVKDQFIRGLLQDVTRKLEHTLPQLLNYPNWLSHTIHQVMEFDKKLRDEFAYDQYTTLSNVILDNPVWFKAWFDAEKSFAQARYDEIMLDGQAFDIYAQDDLDKSTNHGLKPIQRTKSAVRIMNLLENIKVAYELVPNLAQKFKFFVEIQLHLLGQYQKRLSSAIDSFEALSLIRSVPVPGALPDAVTGVMTATETGGTVSALHRLYRWWTSAKSIIDVLKDWTEDEFFLEMQFEINGEPECIQDILEDNDKNNMLRVSRLGNTLNEGLFSDALTAYEGLIQRTEKIILKLIIKEWTLDARKYSKKDTWWQTTTTTTSEANEISDELYQPLQNLRVTWNYLNGILPQPDFLSVFRKSLKDIEEWYWKHIITQSQFSSAGASQLETDLKFGLWKIGQRYTLKPENFTKQLKEVIQLLNLPLSSTDTTMPSCDVLMKALSDTSQLEFVQSTLAKLGIEVLSNGQIRDVLRRRNDMLFSWN